MQQIQAIIDQRKAAAQKATADEAASQQAAADKAAADKAKMDGLVASLNVANTKVAAEEWEVPYKKITWGRELGQGSFGTVFEVQYAGFPPMAAKKTSSYLAMKALGSVVNSSERSRNGRSSSPHVESRA